MKRYVLIGFGLVLCATASAQDSEQGYLLGLGISADNGDGFSASVLGDYSFNDAASISASYATTTAEALPDDITTRDWSIGAQYDFGVLGVSLSGGQSGDPDDFDSDDLKAGVFHRGEHWSWTARYLQRNIDLTFRSALFPNANEVSVPLEATGYRASVTYRTDSGYRWGLSARRYDYDRDLSPLSGRFISQRLSPTTLTLSSALLDDSVDLSVEVPLPNSRAINLQIGTDTLAGNLGDVDSISVGLLMPAGRRGDLEFSMGASDASGVVSGNTVFFSVLYLFYGGFD